MKTRGFEVVKYEYRKHIDKKINLPVRGSKESAGYDFYTPEAFTLKPNEKKVVWTDIKAYMQRDEVLKLYIRSSIGIKKGLILSNGTGIIDKDYYSNVSNDGNIGIAITNISEEEVNININERIAQGVFLKYLVADNDTATEERLGGIGSTGI
ncbi:dUTP diphosphatase [Anaeromonas frigoriresistens]|uniref:dUTP diphosphatase n=1 Tax=Anaeromonas frigoriresistens TaxID=2683708 RepID=UPI001A9C69F1|nr:dUTP diphosphatase [Anaeromonas frigoriresistens]